MHNGATSGSDTENGAYTLQGGTVIPSNLNTVTRNASAKVALPTENEWYKAAYYLGSGTSYALYPMGGTTANKNAPPGDTNSANHNYLLPTSQPPLQDAGSYTAADGFYGTFDQGGNAGEWTETLGTGSNRILRGGDWDSIDSFMQSTFRLDTRGPNSEDYDIGFRVVGL
jgi:formylglycine-generating enzyme required for sulfatase activity